MTDVVETVRRLLALARSPNEHEARTAATRAVALINEHRLVVVEPDALLADIGIAPPPATRVQRHGYKPKTMSDRSRYEKALAIWGPDLHVLLRENGEGDWRHLGEARGVGASYDAFCAHISRSIHRGGRARYEWKLSQRGNDVRAHGAVIVDEPRAR